MAETYIVEGETLNLYVVLHDPRTLSDQERELILRLPSILGRDLINRYCPHFNANRDEVHLER